ncbi:4Fe-4S binding protein [Photobacterium sagamiensis]|uniref:4Fe-4S binding protein n=1 Tax=Photobacterium sagamiensis TaxID=2910241 RepID=UPI003D117FBE
MRLLAKTALEFVEKRELPHIDMTDCADEQFSMISCSACENVCPTNAISNHRIDADKCISCGTCLLVCKSGAIKGVTMPVRDLRDSWLCVTPGMVLSSGELILWVKQKQIKGLLCEGDNPEHVTSLQQLLERVNRALPKSCEPLTIKFEHQVSLNKRRLLTRLGVVGAQSQKKEKSTNGSGQLAATALESHTYEVLIDTEACNSCLTCTRVCKQGALSLTRSDEKASLVIDSSRCNNCKHCLAACLPQALTVNRGEKSNTSTLKLYSLTCEHCLNSFYSQDQSQKQCFICTNARSDRMKE